MLKLATVFENAAGKTHRWSYNEPDPNKTPEQIKEALETMTTLNLFQKDGVRQFYKVVSAKFVQTIETPIFDLSNQAEAYVADSNNAFAPFIVADEAQVAEPVKEELEGKAETPAVETKPEVKPTDVDVEEKAQTKPVAVEVEQNSTLEKIEAARTPKSVVEKAGIHSQAKAALGAAIANPGVETFSTKEPAVKPSAVADAIKKAANHTNEVDSTNSDVTNDALTEKVEADTTDTKPVALIPRTLSPVQARKERIDRLRAYHEANSKKKKGKKKKR